MNQPVYAMLEDLMALTIGGGGPLNGAKVLPYGKPLTITAATIYTDLGVITVPGIVPVTPTWYGPALQPTGTYGVLGSECRFSISDQTQPATITGWAVFTGPGGSGSGSGAPDTLLYVDALLEPITLSDVSQIAAYVPLIDLGRPGTQWNSGTTVF